MIKTEILTGKPNKTQFARNIGFKKENTNISFARPKVEIFKSLLPSLLLISIITMLIMTLYEVIKQELHPEISVWESHMITIVFSGMVAPVAAYFFLRKLEVLRQKNQDEIDSRKEAEQKLKDYQNELEEKVIERTAQLNEMNIRLLDEIAEHKRTENARILSERNYSHLFKYSPVSIFRYNREFFITDYNRKFREFVRSSDSDIRKLKLTEIHDGRILPALKAALQNDEGYYEGEYNSTLSEEMVFISLKTAPSKNENGEIMGGIAIMDNISYRKKYESALISAKEEAEKSDRLKSEFLASMSHEIRTPINTILSFASLIREDVQDHIGEDLADSFNHMEKAGRRIIRTMDLILNMSDLSAETYSIQPVEVDIIDIIDNLYEKLASDIREKQLTFCLNNNCKSTTVMSDEYGLCQIFDNILDNAVKYTAKGNITVSLYELHNSLIADITDTGIGISEQYKEKLFTPFSQEEQGYTRKYEGNGLGLALTKRFADANNVNIEVTSKKGFGSTFRVIIPKSHSGF